MDARARRRMVERKLQPGAPGGRRDERELHSRNPARDQDPNAIHSARVKLPGTNGRTFIRMTASLAAAPAAAAHRPSCRFLRRSAAHAETQPTPTANDPTSDPGTSSASPRKEAPAVRIAIERIAPKR